MARPLTVGSLGFLYNPAARVYVSVRGDAAVVTADQSAAAVFVFGPTSSDASVRDLTARVPVKWLDAVNPSDGTTWRPVTAAGGGEGAVKVLDKMPPSFADFADFAFNVGGHPTQRLYYCQPYTFGLASGAAVVGYDPTTGAVGLYKDAAALGHRGLWQVAWKCSAPDDDGTRDHPHDRTKRPSTGLWTGIGIAAGVLAVVILALLLAHALKARRRNFGP